MTENLLQLWCEGMVFGNLFTLGCEADNQVATTPIMSKIEAVWRMFRFFGCILVLFLCFFWARYNFQRVCATWRSQFGVKPMFSIAQAHPKLGWVGQVWILSVVVPLSSGDQKKYVQMTSKGGSRLRAIPWESDPLTEIGQNAFARRNNCSAL